MTRGDGALTGIDGFVWISIAVMYLIFIMPFLLSSINIANFSGKIPVLSMLWFGIVLYLIASIVVILLLSKFWLLSLNLAIIIQAILLLLFFVNVYFAYFASSHVQMTAAEEKGKLQDVNSIKSMARLISLSVNKLPAEYEKAQTSLKQTLEDIKYIYPVSAGAGEDLEAGILKSLNTISELCGSVSSVSHTTALEPEAENLRMLVKERKLLRD